MSANPLLLYELLTPYFLAGFRFPEEADDFLSFLVVDELHMASDESAITYVGRVQFIEQSGRTAARAYSTPGGGLLEWDDFHLTFRLTIPRDGASFIDSALTAASASTSILNQLRSLFNDLGPVEQTSTTLQTEYPGVRFRLELLFSLISFNLGDDWLPGMVDPASRRIVPDRQANGKVKFVLPKMVFEYEQGDDLSVPPAFRLKSWGSGGFDAPADVEQGEIVRMEPAIAVHTSGRYAFSVDQVLIDLSQDNTPPEIIEQFGTDESFEGLFLKSLRFYYTDEKKEAGFGIAVNDALISFKGEVSFEAEANIYTSRPDIDLTVKFYIDGDLLIASSETTASGAVRDIAIFDNGDHTVAHIEVHGGYPPFSQTVELRPQGAGAALPLSQASGRPGEWIVTMPPGTAHPDGAYTLHIEVTDSAPGTPNTTVRDIPVRMASFPAGSPRPREDGAPRDRPAEAVEASYTPPAAGSVREGYRVVHDGAGGGNSERLRIIGGAATVSAGGADIPVDAGGLALIPVPPGETVEVTVQFPEVQGTPGHAFPCDVLFLVNYPRNDIEVDRYAALNPPVHDEQFLTDVRELTDWIRAYRINSVVLHGYASYEDINNAPSDQRLSERRLKVVRRIIEGMGPGITVTAPESNADGQAQSRQEWEANGRSNHYRGQPEDRKVTVSGTSAGTPASSTTLTFSRPPSPGSGSGTDSPPQTNTRTPERRDPPMPATPPDRAPAWMKRLGVRVRIERNVPVLLELSGQIDFDTEMEAYRRRLTARRSSDLPLMSDDPVPSGGDSVLGLRSRPGATADSNPEDGVVDFTLNVTYDTSTHLLSETVTLGAAPGDRDGLLEGVYDTAQSIFWRDLAGALLVFAPVINEAADNIDNEGTEGDIAALAVSIGIPVAIAALGIFRTKRLTLYGGELKMRQYLPQNSSESLLMTDTGIVFDYGVELLITLQSLGIQWDAPVKVRYKAVGFNIAFNQPDKYQPIFDTSKGYEIDLGDPGRASLPAPLNELLSVLSARIARVNPVIFEIDVGVKANLGVITVDRFKIRAALTEPTSISIQAAGVRIEIPSTVSGSGYVEIVDRTDESGTQKGFEGAIDITIIPMKLRVASSLAIVGIHENSTGRDAVAVYFGLTVEFPAPILLGSTGLGIFGFSGLFAMHYRRSEDDPVPGAAVSPALEWLIKADGEPAHLKRKNPITETTVTLWEPKIDRWSFGVGVVLGTVEGGFVMNFRGMFLLELPGPRILIFVKIQIVAELPDMKPAGNEMRTGMLGVIDLDFNLGQITIGVVVDFKIESIVQVRIPIEIFFSLRDSNNWHLYIGTINQPITAMILNIVRGTGYFMVAGNGIRNLPLPDDTTRDLQGMSVAVGIGASIIFGDTDIGLYLKVAARADMGVSFLPEKLYIVGGIQITGELRLFIVGISAKGLLIVEAPNPTYIYGEVCGKVSLLFFDVEGCVKIEIGQKNTSFPAPDLIKKVYLQSFAPVVLAGQGGDRPIDGSLGDAHTVIESEGSHKVLTQQGNIALMADGTIAPADRSKVLTVPIDSVIVVQFGIVPVIDAGSPTSFFTESPGHPPSTPEGWVSLGNDRYVRYMLREVALSRILPAAGGTPPAVWRRELFSSPPDTPDSPPAQGPDTQINLALMSRIPTTAARALERSSDLNRQVEGRWSRTCTPVAPPACVLWTFCGQPFGPSGAGWHLRDGIAEPDPDGTRRDTPTPTHLFVEEPPQTSEQRLANTIMSVSGKNFDVPAQIVGYNPPAPPESDGESDKVCIDFSGRAEQRLPNPYEENGAIFEVFDYDGNPLTANIVVDYGAVGLNVGFRTEIELPICGMVRLSLLTAASDFEVVALDVGGNKVAYAKSSVNGSLETVELIGAGIVRLYIEAFQNETVLTELCYTRAGTGSGKTCLDFATGEEREIENPYKQGQVQIYCKSRQDYNKIVRIDSYQGILAEEVVEVRVPPSSEVELAIFSYEGLAVYAFNDNNDGVDKQEIEGGKEPHIITLRGDQITQIVLECKGTVLLLRLCYGEEQAPGGQPDMEPIGDIHCMRALRLPAIREQTGGLDLFGDEWDGYSEKMLGERWVTFHTGEASSVHFLFAYSAADTLSALVVCELDRDDNTLAETPVTDYIVSLISGIDDLPKSWRDPAKPWRHEVEPVLTLFAMPEYAGLQVLYAEVKPSAPTCERIRLRIPQHDAAGGLPGVLVGAVEICSKAEEVRALHEENIKETEIKTVTDYLNGGDVVPLLEPDCDYVLTISYEAQVKAGSDVQPAESKSQEFFFRTDKTPPARLDNYILGTTPDENEPCHFYDDPVKLVFNDLATLQLYDTYGYSLRTVLRSSDGNPVKYVDPSGSPTDESSSLIEALQPVAGQFHSPYRDTLSVAVKTGKVLPCIEDIGDIHHGQYTLPVLLRPQMSYTLDVELIDKATGNPPTMPEGSSPIAPLYRRRFTTSRFASMAQLGEALGMQRARHRALRSRISLAGVPDTAMGSEAATDQQLLDALTAAGEQALPAAEEIGFTIYWAKRPGETHYSPHAILLDAPEPLWRWRDEPVLNTVPNQTDSDFKMVVPGRNPELRVKENGSSSISRFVRSTGGTRTLAFIKDSYAGSGIQLVLQRDRSELYELDPATAPLLSLNIGLIAPWEEDADE